MATKIRLTRGGRKKRPFYHVIVADARAPRDGRYIEKLGFWNPLTKELNWDAERVNHWLSTGAQPTDTVAKMVLREKLGSDKQRAEYAGLIARRTEIVRKRVEAEAAAKVAEEAAAAAEAAASEAEASAEA